MKDKLRPLSNRVLVEPDPEEKTTKGGIVLPDTAKEKPQEGTVIAVGPGKYSEKGDRIPMEVKVGDKVLYSKYGGTEVKIDDREYIILSESEILAAK